MKNILNKSQIERYSRQLVIKNIGPKGQKKLLSSKVLIVGVGGLGCPAAENLVRAGVGTIGLIDNDVVSLSNIHRQSLFNSKDINKSKVVVAKKILKEINPQIKIKTFQNLVFKILGFSKKEIIYSSLIEFVITFFSIILFSTIFSIISSIFIIENIFQLKWLFEFDIFLNVTITVGLVTMILIVFTNLKYLSPKVYPLVRNE